ncbi:MAG: 3-oxoacyl-[acyl-carrier-protein] reductase [Desulfovibrio sp.]|jgi:3-oxoacyl-[acyl-carrier protein] reductase|nr:3-oxoacyl-[acyl-carrier-protein] reductase [Desulfovibrio sp.]
MSEKTLTALVTGASRGIGKCIAESLAKAGYQVYLTYASKAAEAETAAEDIRAAGGKARAFHLDVSDAHSVKDFFATEIKDKTDLHILVNNAGITADSLLISMKDEDFDKVLDVDLKGAFICTREAARILIRRRSGRIVNIASVVGQTGNAGQANYSAAKAGLIGLTKATAKELAGRNVTVNAVAPGFIETDMTRALPESAKAQYLMNIPLKRFGAPEDVAEAVLFLASDKAGYITGQVLAVNGGMYC